MLRCILRRQEVDVMFKFDLQLFAHKKKGQGLREMVVIVNLND